jgi:hypothetical protein
MDNKRRLHAEDGIGGDIEMPLEARHHGRDASTDILIHVGVDRYGRILIAKIGNLRDMSRIPSFMESSFTPSMRLRIGGRMTSCPTAFHGRWR